LAGFLAGLLAVCLVIVPRPYGSAAGSQTPPHSRQGCLRAFPQQIPWTGGHGGGRLPNQRCS
jgi:hypothetical protein